MKHSTLSALIAATLFVAPAGFAYEKGDWLVRGGLTNVAPDDETSNILLDDADLGIGLTVGADTQLGINVAYFISDRLNVELLAATPFTHKVDFGVSDPLGTGDKLGEVTHLPPTLSVNYYFSDPASAFQPYLGAGVNYTIFFDEEFTAANTDAGLADLELDNSLGLSAQVGADWVLNNKWHINGSVRWIDIDTEASFNLNGTPGKVSSIQIDPWVYTLSLGYRF
ncbi:outer membrane protein OmpW [Alteromonas aestuariivivens]|uniref:Outer membrane protein OmpW n=1 Tax=Alteromonas aestuariivivens TaxID=1938339 RepID=A0A3D8M584_9ALTE|nr:OmpW family outer membrane protein [Alteromonas aestuariivivens]RDV24750.1 outer membrane protein OmpW [Alteromonas aestuariivivens]